MRDEGEQDRISKTLRTRDCSRSRINAANNKARRRFLAECGKLKTKSSHGKEYINTSKNQQSKD